VLTHSMPATIASLLSAAAVRTRAHMILERGRRGQLAHFKVQLDQLPHAATYVAATIRQNYPDLRVPPHARWRHFVIGAGNRGDDRWQALAATLVASSHERARIRFDLGITSVLLDAGAGPQWRWRDSVSGATLSRSEGLAIASLAAFTSGLFSSDPAAPLRADASGLQAITAERLGAVFQVSDTNPLVGLEGRAALMRRLGQVMAANPSVFGHAPRLGGLFNLLAATAASQGQSIAAPEILALLLTALGPVWPDRMAIDGVALGDTWRHDAIDVEGPTCGLMPIHKLSQWLAYSLIEPLEEAGIRVTDLDGLTGLAEYRNGGLFLDLGVIVPRDAGLLTRPLAPGDEPIVEWRALTVALLDEVAPLIRARLGKTADEMPLAAILEGGTWSAGRRIAREKRADASPPLNIISDGSVF
jgi:Protein of unknown function (DUF1688)